MLGYQLITKQTPKDGILVNKVMVAESVDIKRETYFCILMDRYVKLLPITILNYKYICETVYFCL